jgi:hypothetical protein
MTCARQCLDVNVSFVKAMFQKYYQPLEPLVQKERIIFCSTLSEFENFLVCERIVINVTTCQNETSS